MNSHDFKHSYQSSYSGGVAAGPKNAMHMMFIYGPWRPNYRQ